MNSKKLLPDSDIPKKIPVVLLRSMRIFPYIASNLIIEEDNDIEAVNQALNSHRLIGLWILNDVADLDPPTNLVGRIGILAAITRMKRLPDNTVSLFVQGVSRIEMTSIDYEENKSFMFAEMKILEDKQLKKDKNKIKLLTANARNLAQLIMKNQPYPIEKLLNSLESFEDGGQVADIIAAHLKLSSAEQQKMLDLLDIAKRLEYVNELLLKEKQLLELSDKLQNKFDKQQKEFYLRQELEAIKEELGDIDLDLEDEIEDDMMDALYEKYEKRSYPEEVKEQLDREFKKLRITSSNSSDYAVILNYIEWLIELPWKTSTKDHLDIKNAQQILEEDHYGLKEVKDRIIEYLAVRKLKSDLKGPILCFVGPPGVGKTSMGKSIARALNRKFYRISLGGLKDEAEIRGHRRTYVGAMPGRIIQGLRKVDTNNPVFMLDEVDKIGIDFRGDPASALLEVLDPEQNDTFADNFVEVPFDLSQVMFITTANILETIPSALKDRLEIIRLPGYIDEEKFHICKKYLIPKQTEENGLSKKQITISDKAVRLIISEYTVESGVRNLERKIAQLCRKAAKEISIGKTKKVRVTAKNITDFLGKPKVYKEIAARRDQIGLATGMAWTPYGGEILFIESLLAPGKGKLTITGQLGDVMKESTIAALSLIKSRSEKYNINTETFEKYDIHIHVPAGAIPKDGPSAGVAIATSLLSSITNSKVNRKIAMTGEITLRGEIMPVGGIKEKVIAAQRAGIEIVLLPEHNKNDIEEIPEKIRKKLTIKKVKFIDDVFNTVFVEKKTNKKRKIIEAVNEE